MLTRRSILRAGGLAIAGVPLTACGPAGDDYAAVAAGIWRHTPGIPDNQAGILAELARYASLAPSTWNSQCWQFRAAPEALTILPDPARRSPAIDPHDHHLHVSLGCATENIVQSAAALGLFTTVEVGPEPGDGITVKFEIGIPSRSPMAEAIPLRQTTRTAYSGKPVPAADLKRLERVAFAPGVTPVIASGEVQIRRILDLAVAANRDWYAEPAKVAEMKRWTRFDIASAIDTRDGLAPGPTGQTPLPPRLGAMLFDMLASADRANDRLAADVRSSAGLVAFISATNDRANWIETGRALQRFALLATTLGIRLAWVNSPAEMPLYRPQLGMELGEPAGRPSLLLRYGYAPAITPSLRRDLTPVL